MRAEIVYLFAFDVAAEIATGRVRSILFQSPAPFNIQTDHTFPRDIPFHRPLSLEVPLTVSLNEQPVRALVRVYEIGVITIALRVGKAVETLSELARYHQPRSSDGRTLDEVARELCGKVRDSLGSLLIHPVPTSEPEAYTAFCLTEMPGVDDVNSWLAAHGREAAGLLTETAPERLSDAQVAEVLRLQRSLTKTDVVVIDWDAALVIDLDGYVDDVLYVLEMANLPGSARAVLHRAMAGERRTPPGATGPAVWNGAVGSQRPANDLA